MKTIQDQVSKAFGPQNQDSDERYEEAPFITACLTYLGFCLLMIVGFINQLFFMPEVATEKERDGYVPLFESYQTFYFYYL
jgi:serine palmitoyltransferase